MKILSAGLPGSPRSEARSAVRASKKSAAWPRHAKAAAKYTRKITETQRQLLQISETGPVPHWKAELRSGHKTNLKIKPCAFRAIYSHDRVFHAIIKLCAWAIQNAEKLKGHINMRIRVGYELVYDCPQPVPMLLVLNIHYSRAADILVPDQVTTSPAIPMSAYRDSFGNWCSKMTAPRGRLTIASTALVQDTGNKDPYVPAAWQHPIEELPDDALQFLLASRYCETELLSDIAWTLFGKTETGWPRVQAVCDFVHQHISFGYEHARPTKTAFEVFHERRGVCRDYAHLAITFCRCLNIPARYCTGYLGDIGMEPPFGPMDFAGWFEAYLGGQWYTFDPRNNMPRIGRVLIARGRDATDVAIATTFGPNILASFTVITDEVMEAA